MRENNLLKYAIKYWVLSLISRLEYQIKRLDNNECTNDEMKEASELIKYNLDVEVTDKYNNDKGRTGSKKSFYRCINMFGKFLKK